MSFVDLGTEFGDTEETEVVAEGRYNLTVRDMLYVNEGEKNHIRVILNHDDAPIPNASNIFHYIALPKPDDDDEKRKMKMLMTKRFLFWFAIPFEGNGFDMNDIEGASGSNIPVVQETYEGRQQNKLNLPPVPKGDDGSHATGRGSRRRK